MPKNVIYDREFLCEISNTEANRLLGILAPQHNQKRPQTVVINGQLLQAKKVEILNTRTQQSKETHEMSMEELKEIVGDFEEEYNKHNTGEMEHNDIIGDEKAGIIRWCIQMNWIKKRQGMGYIEDCVCYPAYFNFKQKYDAMKELRGRRNFAEKEELKRLEKTLTN